MVFRCYEKPQRIDKTIISQEIAKCTNTIIGFETNLLILCFLVAIYNKVYILMCIWIILEHRNVEKMIKKIPREVLARYLVWKEIVRGVKGQVDFNE